MGSLDKTEELFSARREMVKGEVPDRGYEDEEFGKSGNRALKFNCAYCDFKHTCWPGLRTFMAKKWNGYQPVYMSKVEKEPKMMEVTDE